MTLEKFMAFLDRFARHSKVLMITGILSVGLVFLQAWFSLFTIDATRDSNSYYYAAKAISESGNPYDLDLLQSIARREGEYTWVGPYVYPPVFAGFWRGMTWMSADQVHHLLILADAIFFGLAVWLMTRIVRPAKHPHALFFLFLLMQVINGPAVTCLRMGQITPMFFLLILICLHAHVKGKETLSALALAVAILLKISPMVLLLYFFLFYSRRWRYLIKVCGFMLLLIVASLPLAPLYTWSDFLEGTLGGLPLKAPYSVWGWLQLHTLPATFLENIKPLIYLLICVPLTILTVVSIKNQEVGERPLYAFAMLTMLSLLIAPLTWHQHYYVWILPGLYFVSYHWARQHKARACIWAFLVLMVMTRAPEPLLMLRPAGTFIAMLLGLRLRPIRIRFS